MGKKFVTSQEAAHFLEMRLRNLNKLVRKNKITSYRVGGKILRFDLTELEEFKRREGTLYKFRYEGMINRIGDFWRFADTYILFALVLLICVIAIIYVID